MVSSPSFDPNSYMTYVTYKKITLHNK
ncbi:hypothetical protein DIJ63_38245, partial [Burkholderia pseudomallei]